MPRRIRPALTVVILSVLLAAGCSSGSSGWTKVDLHGDKSATSIPPTSGQSASNAVGPASTGGAAGPTPTNAPSGATPADGSASPQRPAVTLDLSGPYCTRVQQLTSKSSTLMAFDESGDPASQLASLKQSFATVDDAYRQVQAKAPAAIATDIGTVVTAFGAANTKVQQLTTFDQSALGSIMSGLQTTEVKDASARIETYTSQHCSISSS